MVQVRAEIVAGAHVVIEDLHTFTRLAATRGAAAVSVPS